MSKNLKTFEDLKFKSRFTKRELEGYKRVSKQYYEERKDATRANLKFPNGYEVNVVCGRCFYSNGVDTYEVAVMYDRMLCYDTPITSNVIPYQTAEEVTGIMRDIQELPKRVESEKQNNNGKDIKVR